MKIQFPNFLITSLLISISLLSMTGCGTVRLEVPPGHDVRLLEQDEYAEIRVQRTVWFWLWGARPISDNSTQQDILEHNFKEVRLQTEQNMTDNLTILITGWFSIVRRTMIVEGNQNTIIDVPVNQLEAKSNRL